MTETFYVLECEVSGTTAEFFVNDIPLTRRGMGIGHYLGAPINQYLVDGVNQLKLVIEPGPIPSESESGRKGKKTVWTPGEEKVWAKIKKYPRGAVVGGPDGRLLLEAEWPIRDSRQNRDDFQPQEYPLAVVEERDLGEMFGPFEWQAAPQLALDDDTRGEIEDLLRELCESLAAGDPEPYIKLQANRISETARAYNNSPREKAVRIRQVTAEDAAQSWWGFEPLDPEQFDLRLVAGQRLIQCIARDWNAIVREHEDDEGGRSYYPLMVGKLNRTWAIMR